MDVGAVLGVKARVAMYAATLLWHDEDKEPRDVDDLDWEDHQLRKLIETVCALAGLPTAPMEA
jgi:hypothetical protein